MSSIKTKIIGFSIIYSSLLALILMLILVIFEVSGLSEKLSENTVLKSSMLPGNLLIKTDYYGSNLKDDPYENFTIQHLHPYYLFSLPWRKNDILSAYRTASILRALKRELNVLAGKYLSREDASTVIDRFNKAWAKTKVSVGSTSFKLSNL